jgi:zinc transporter ZupT
VAHAPALAAAIEGLLEERMGAREAAGDAHAAETWRAVARSHLGRHLSAMEEKALLQEHDSSSAPLAIFLGALVDGVPESLVIGATMVGGAAPSLSFLMAVFLSNFPEAMSSATGMTRVGFSRGRIIGMWCGLAALSGLAALLGNALLSHAAPAVLALAEAVAGGGILALLSNTMMPEAFELGGRRVAFATIAGFLIAFMLAMYSAGGQGDEASAVSLCVSLSPAFL